jgi:hypothetical protein
MIEKMPDDAVIVSSLTITNFINNEGKSCHALTLAGNTTLVQTLGALELVKFNVLALGVNDNE